MDNNDIFRRLRYTLGYNDHQMAKVFAETGSVINQESVTLWLKKHEDPQFLAMSDVMLATFLNGLINKLRGKKTDHNLLQKKHSTIISYSGN